MEHINSTKPGAKSPFDILNEADRESNTKPHVEKLIDLLGSDALDKLLKKKALPTGTVLRVWRRSGKRMELKELEGRTYHFEIWPSRRKYKSQTTEIRGDRRLEDLDSKIRRGFDLSTFDHLSEFFLATGRGWDSWGLGPIYPDGTGKGADIIVGDLKLSEGDQLSYIYDWGERHRFILTLKEIDL